MILLILIVSTVVFGSAIIFALLKFALPRGEWVQVGVVSSFPPSETPYRLSNPNGFLVNIDGEITVLSSRVPHPVFDTCLIDWNTELNRFQEPCGGSYFALSGAYMGGPSPRGMDSYAVRFEGDKVWVKTTILIPGEHVPTGEP